LARILGSDAASISEAAAIVKRGGLVAFPTDTVYGLGCDPWNSQAIDRLFESKGRETKPIPVLCTGLEQAESLVALDGLAFDLARRFWPGALTIVAPLKRPVPRRLDQGTGWLGVRVPDHEVARAFAQEAGGSITGTSANLSGQPSSRTAEEVDRSIGDRLDAVIDGGRSGGTESTVVKVVGGSVEVLRRGAIGIDSGITRGEFQ
jgi:L-threonylcarbamoyladenylate synthase